MNVQKNNHGIWRIIPSPSITEMIAQSGYDFQIFDCEHGPYDYQTLENDIRACCLYGCFPFVRVGGLHKIEVQRCLDMGAKGIVFPQLQSLEDFKQVVRLMSYPPLGVRGFNPFVRSREFGISTTVFKKPLCMGIIETLEAVNDLDKILALEGIDMIFIGAYDLSGQLGCIGEMDHPALTRMMDDIIHTSVAHSKPVGVMITNIDHYKKRKEQGVTMFHHRIDSYEIKKTFMNVIAQLND